jgi:AcrR family transcriptional regulator
MAAGRELAPIGGECENPAGRAPSPRTPAGQSAPPVDSVNGHYPEFVPATRDRLIDAAAQLLDEGGPAAVTLREVGRLAGVSHNAPYKHFADKEDLLAAVAARDLSRPRQPAPGGAGSPAEALSQLMHGYVEWALRHPARFKLTFGSWTGDSAELAEAATAARSALVQTVTAAQASKDLPDGDPERLAALILAATHGAVDLALSGHLAKAGKGHADPQDLVDDLLTYLSR